MHESAGHLVYTVITGTREGFVVKSSECNPHRLWDPQTTNVLRWCSFSSWRSKFYFGSAGRDTPPDTSRRYQEDAFMCPHKELAFSEQRINTTVASTKQFQLVLRRMLIAGSGQTFSSFTRDKLWCNRTECDTVVAWLPAELERMLHSYRGSNKTVLATMVISTSTALLLLWCGKEWKRRAIATIHMNNARLSR